MGVRPEVRLSVPQTLAGRRPQPFHVLVNANAQARGDRPSAPLFRVSENFPTLRIPGPQHPKRPSRSSLPTTSQLRNPSELVGTSPPYPTPTPCPKTKTGSSVPYKAAHSLSDLPGLLESSSLNASQASFTKHKSIPPLCFLLLAQ